MLLKNYTALNPGDSVIHEWTHSPTVTVLKCVSINNMLHQVSLTITRNGYTTDILLVVSVKVLLGAIVI